MYHVGGKEHVVMVIAPITPATSTRYKDKVLGFLRTLLAPRICTMAVSSLILRAWPATFCVGQKEPLLTVVEQDWKQMWTNVSSLVVLGRVKRSMPMSFLWASKRFSRLRTSESYCDLLLESGVTGI